MAQLPPQDVQAALGVEVLHFLGSGSFKRVFAAVSTVTGEEVVMTCEAVSAQQEVENEVMHRLAAQPAHPQLIGPPTGHESNWQLVAYGNLYSVLQRAQTELFDVLTDSGGSVAEQLARTFFVQSVAALRFMHQNGVAHRDIKLENIMLDRYGRLKLIDFGLAHVAPLPEPPHAPMYFSSATSVGTRSYTAPEVGSGLLYDTRACDVWSLGCTFFALCAGFFVVDRAHTSDPRFQRMQAAQATGNSAVRAIFALYNRPCPLSPGLVALLDGMLTIDPSRRWTLDQVIVAEWVSAAYAPFVALEATYRTPLLNRQRASARWSRVVGPTHAFGRALVALRDVLEEVMYRPGHTGAATARADFYSEAEALDALPPSVSRASSGGASMLDSLPLPSLPAIWRSTSNMSDDELGPPVWRSAVMHEAPDVSEADPFSFGGVVKGLVEAVAPLKPPPVARQKAALDVRKEK